MIKNRYIFLLCSIFISCNIEPAKKRNSKKTANPHFVKLATIKTTTLQPSDIQNILNHLMKKQATNNG